MKPSFNLERYHLSNMGTQIQVIVPGHSRLGRVKIPTCIACDRPMVGKSRHRDKLPELDDAHPNPSYRLSRSAGDDTSTLSRPSTR